MDKRVESLKRKLKNREPVMGTHTVLRDGMISELYGEIGFDYVWIDTEHSALDRQGVLSHLMGARASGTCGLVRVPWNDPVLVKPFLDMGADGIIFPMVCNRQEAEKAVAACEYPPRGCRGFGPNRAMRYGLTPQEEYCGTDGEGIVKLLQIEHTIGVWNVEEILEVPGIDGIIIGAQDLSASLGKIGQIYDREVDKQIEQILEACVRKGVSVGISCGFDKTFMRSFVERGASILTVELDYGYILKGALEVFETAADMLGVKTQGRQQAADVSV